MNSKMVVVVIGPSLTFTMVKKGLLPELSAHYSRDLSESVNMIGVISEPFAREFR